MHSVAEKMCLSEPTTKIEMKIGPYYQWQKCRQMCLVSGSIRFMQIFVEVPRGGVSNYSVFVEIGNFKRFLWLFFQKLRDDARVIV